jgi:hypothetical protein
MSETSLQLSAIEALRLAVTESYTQSAPETPPEIMAASVSSAFAIQRDQHPDFDSFAPLMLTLGGPIYVDPKRVNPLEFLEVYYAICRYADFTESVRANLALANIAAAQDQAILAGRVN